MQFLQLVLLLAILLAVLQCVIWLRRSMYATALFGCAYIVVYMVDTLNISLSGVTYIAASIGSRNSSDQAVALATGFVVATWVLFSLGAEFLSKLRTSEQQADIKPSRPRFSFVSYLFLASVFAGVVLSKIVSVGIAATLELRQSVFSDNFLILLGYFILPVLAALGITAASGMRGIRAMTCWIVAICLLVVTALMGSRSGLFLGALIPALAYLWKVISSSRRSIKRDLQRFALVLIILAIPVMGGSIYLASTRGLVESNSVLSGTDISQADVLVDLISSEAGGVAEGATYLASVTSFVPRNLWPEKPLPGNVISSEVLTPERYHITGAETTAGLLGEAYLNVGVAAPVIAALLMLLLLWICSGFLRSSDDIVWVVGVILVIRGLNLLRGDMTNVLVPAVSAILVWWFVCKKARIGSKHLRPNRIGDPDRVATSSSK